MITDALPPFNLKTITISTQPDGAVYTKQETFGPGARIPLHQFGEAQLALRDLGF